MEKTILGPGIVAYKNAIKKEWNMVERLEKSLGDDSKQFKWRGARVGYFQTDNNSRNCQDFIYTKELLGEKNNDVNQTHLQVHYF